MKILWRSDKPFKAIEKHTYGLRETVSKHLNYNTRFYTVYYVILKLYDSEALGGGRKGDTNTTCALQLEIFIL